MTPARTSDRWRAVADVPALVGFRLAALRGRRRRAAHAALLVLVVVTVLAASVPAFLPGAAASARATDLAVLLPTGLLAFLLTTTVATTVGGGGRELLPNGHGVAFPVSPTTDHLGALLLAPLNLAWLVQAWSLLGATAYAAGPTGLLRAQTTVAAWLLATTAAAQLVAWSVEWVRRGPRGPVVIRGVTAGVALAAAGVGVAGDLGAVLDRVPTRGVVLVALAEPGDGAPVSWLLGTAAVALGAVLAVLLGARVAHAVARRPARDQHRGEGHRVTARANPRSPMAALVRTDRASVWRSVPLRRGLATLALLPTAVTALGSVEWNLLPLLPGVVAAGGALLFGVNGWCLDGRGALWRDSLPVRPGLVFAARSRVLVEVLAVTTLLPVLAAALRTGDVPSAAEAVSLAATVLVVALQVVARAMHWSVRRPYASDLRSSRGAPAPPLAMVGYSAYLAFTATLTGMLFMLTAQAAGPAPAVLLALPLLLLAARRLVVTAREWETPQVRAEVVATVAA